MTGQIRTGSDSDQPKAQLMAARAVSGPTPLNESMAGRYAPSSDFAWATLNLALVIIGLGSREAQASPLS